MTYSKKTLVWIFSFTTGLTGIASAAFADGEYYQFDLSPTSSTMVGSVVRGNIGAAAGLSLYDGGGALSVNTTYALDIPRLGDDTVVRVGPTARLDQSTDFDLGAKVAVENFSSTSWGGIFLLADYNTIQGEYLLLAEISERQSGFSTSFAVQGDNDTFRENTLIVSYDVPDSDLRLRLGYKFESEEIVFGFSINTF